MVRLPIENSAKRYEFYSRVARTIGKREIGFIALQHCLKDLPLISIVHTEIILSIGKLLELHSEAIYGLRDSGANIKQLAANLWLSEFIDERSGRYADFT